MPTFSNKDLIKDIPRQFTQLLNRSELSEVVFKNLLQRYYLENVDLEHEMELINKRQSNLSANQRLAVVELLKVKKMLDEKKNQDISDFSSLA